MSVARDRVYAGGAIAFMALAVWGSWYPFVIHTIPPERVAVMLRWSIAPAQFSLSDAVSNLLLFIPIGVFIAPLTGSGAGLLPLVATIAAGASLSFVLELGQLLVPDRIPSAIDLAAETLGLVLGIAVWRFAATELDALIANLIRGWLRVRAYQRALWLYTGAFAVAWLLPFDFTLRPDEIADKFFHERLLLPWMRSLDGASGSALAVMTMAAIPIGWTAVLGMANAHYRRAAKAALSDAGVFLVSLTVLQAAVFSRTTDSRLMLAAMAGAAVGVLTGVRLTRRAARARSPRSTRITVLATTWVITVFMVEWWPFQFNLDIDRAFGQFAAWSYAPFRAPATAYDVLPGAILAIAAAAFTARHRRSEYARLQSLVALGVAAGIFAAAEAGGLLIAGHEPTLTSVAVKVLAFAITVAAASGWRAVMPSPTVS